MMCQVHLIRIIVVVPPLWMGQTSHTWSAVFNSGRHTQRENVIHWACLEANDRNFKERGNTEGEREKQTKTKNTFFPWLSTVPRFLKTIFYLHFAYALQDS